VLIPFVMHPRREHRITVPMQNRTPLPQIERIALALLPWSRLGQFVVRKRIVYKIKMTPEKRLDLFRVALDISYKVYKEDMALIRNSEHNLAHPAMQSTN